MRKQVIGILQGRLGSTRLPGKVLADILGQPMFARQIERLRHCRGMAKLILATTRAQADRPLVQLAEKLSIPIFQGSENDVLDRYYQAARCHAAEVVVRVTADCPLIDPGITDAVIDLYLNGGVDYASTGSKYPDGLDTEAFSFSALKVAWKEARLASEREHVTPFIWKNPKRFKITSLTPKTDLSSLRWTVDYPQDMKFVREVYTRLYKKGEVFLMQDVLSLLSSEPALGEINQGIIRNDGYAKSLAEDHEVQKIS